ncbi:unnamed protein product [Rangifer tarandus platyrhynchus]|uniref:Uncharacterized protein n=2 Tax=Rangifer tarandus platyrhynchus TaxID=3082113 RepID=A0AC59Z357_RANTA|nr:unnamed protein product [Rangifer tarandus platyrhynchus]
MPWTSLCVYKKHPQGSCCPVAPCEPALLTEPPVPDLRQTLVGRGVEVVVVVAQAGCIGYRGYSTRAGAQTCPCLGGLYPNTALAHLTHSRIPRILLWKE